MVNSTRELIEESSPDRGQNRASRRILSVFAGFASDTAEFGITELSLMLGMTKNMIYRALTTLAEQGYIVRTASGQRYQLGYRVVELQNFGLPEPDLRALAAPAMRQIYELMGESVSLVTRGRDYAVVIDGIQTRRPGTYSLEIGGLRPLHGPASGMVMLAFGPPQEVEAYLKRHPRLNYPGRRTMTANNLRAELEVIRKRGYGKIVHTGTSATLGVAFPLWSADGKLHGVLSTGGPEDRFALQLGQKLALLRQIIDELVSKTRLYPAGRADWGFG